MATAVERVRLAAVGGLGVVAVIYMQIGFSVVVVTADQTGVVPPMLLAGAVFAVLAAGLAVSNARWVPAVGAALQLVVLVGYVVIASERTPAYELWGVTTKALQVLLLIALAYLALRRPVRTAVQPRGERTLSRL